MPGFILLWSRVYLHIKEKYKRIKQRNVIGVETNISTPIIPAIYKINQ